MKRYKDWNPTPFDIKGLNVKEKQEWLVSPCIKTRDSDALERSNFQIIFDKFDALDPDEENWEVCSFNHWACGWFEIIIVKEDSSVGKAALAFESSLEEYPILDEDHYSQLTFEEEE